MAGPAFRAVPVRVRVPASSANLGPGFDSFGLALGLYDDVVVRVAGSGLRVDVAGAGADTVERDERNLVVRALRAVFDRLGGHPRGLDVVCANRIPHGRGLGSSAAAIVAGVLAGRALSVGGDDALDEGAMLAFAAQLEGHADNVAACLYGGVTLTWATVEGPQVLRLDPHPAVTPVVFVPAETVPTTAARGLLPAAVPHRDAAENAARAALLTEALTRRPDLLFAATEDRLHQHYRAPAMPRTAEFVEELRGAGVPAVVSGAGPSVLALVDAARVEAVAARAGAGWSVHRLEVDVGGAAMVPVVG